MGNRCPPGSAAYNCYLKCHACIVALESIGKCLKVAYAEYFMNNRAVLIPIKDFESAKVRLSKVLDSDARADLAKELATSVVTACNENPVYIACEDDAVESWARDLGAEILRNPSDGLNEAVDFGFRDLQKRGFESVLITHGDLIYPEGLPSLFGMEEIVIVPDTELDGTNVLVLPTRIPFEFSYGPNSYTRHLKSASKSEAQVLVVTDSKFAFDIDDPDDLHHVL